MQSQERVAKLVEWFARAAQRHAAAMEDMAETAAAAGVRDLDRYWAALRRGGEVESLLRLLDHPDPAVAGMVAVYAIREAPQRCVAALTVIAAQPGLIGFRARAALERWESGAWDK